MAVNVRFGSEEEGRISKDYGPFPFVHLKGSELLVGPTGPALADRYEGEWFVKGETDIYFSVTIFQAQEEAGR